jgi:hypothetical protein
LLNGCDTNTSDLVRADAVAPICTPRQQQKKGGAVIMYIHMADGNADFQQVIISF